MSPRGSLSYYCDTQLYVSASRIFSTSTSNARSVFALLQQCVDISRAFIYRCRHVSTPTVSPPPPQNKNPVDQVYDGRRMMDRTAKSDWSVPSPRRRRGLILRNVIDKRPQLLLLLLASRGDDATTQRITAGQTSRPRPRISLLHYRRAPTDFPTLPLHTLY